MGVELTVQGMRPCYSMSQMNARTLGWISTVV